MMVSDNEAPLKWRQTMKNKDSGVKPLEMRIFSFNMKNM